MTALQIPPSRGLTALETRLRTVMVEAVEASGYTHAAIARRAGLHRTTVSHVLSGRRAGTVDTWDLILIAADVQMVAVVS